MEVGKFAPLFSQTPLAAIDANATVGHIAGRGFSHWGLRWVLQSR